jgi:3-deoxy-D-manno-octulosonic-acid transferase
VNGRISDRSFKGYLSIKFLISPVLNKISLFCVQTSRDAERLLRLGLAKNKIKITGNMKFDLEPQSLNFDASGLRLKYQEQLLVSGSTHPGEEKIILNAYRILLGEFPDLRLLIAPRHPERTTEIERLIKGMGFSALRISKLRDLTNPSTQAPTVFILDTVGQLLNYYAIADIVFVGGSLVKKGGHNILEPAVLGKPIIFGPSMFNFRDIADLFLNNKAAILVRNQQDFKNSVKYLLNHPAKITELSQGAKELIHNNQGATRKNLEYITSHSGH